MDALVAATVLALSFIVIVVKAKLIRYVLGYQGWLDVAVTVGLFFLFSRQGTVTALLIAIFGGFIFSIICSVLYRVMPHKRLARVADGKGNIRWKWIDCPPAKWWWQGR